MVWMQKKLTWHLWWYWTFIEAGLKCVRGVRSDKEDGATKGHLESTRSATLGNRLGTREDVLGSNETRCGELCEGFTKRNQERTEKLANCAVSQRWLRNSKDWAKVQEQIQKIQKNTRYRCFRKIKRNLTGVYVLRSCTYVGMKIKYLRHMLLRRTTKNVDYRENLVRVRVQDR